MRKRRFAFGAVGLALFVGVACQSPSGSPSGSAAGSGATGFAACGNQDAGDAFKIGGVTDVGDLEDKSFNEAGWCGTLTGNESVGGTAEVLVTESTEDYTSNMQSFVDEDFDIIVTFGSALNQDTLAMAKANPDVKFIGLDQKYCIDAEGNNDTEPADAPDCDGDDDFATLLPNLQGLYFSEAEPGYLAGVLACSISETGVIGAVGGIFAIPPVPQYIGGYHNGCLSVNPDATVLVEYVSEDISVAFNDPDTGRQLADQMVAADADVLFQVAGGSGQGVLSAACDNDLYAIGVDVDQYFSSPAHQACLVTSAEKKIIAAISAAIERVGDGSDVGGNVLGDATNGGIGLAPYHNFEDLITDDIQAAVDDALAALADGSVDPCEGPGECFFDPDE
jgi:basic membrane protein A and related proteins